MELNIELFMQTLPMMGKGMLGIFIVTVVLILGILLMNKLTSGRKDRDEE
jgi:hypothetical protein